MLIQSEALRASIKQHGSGSRAVCWLKTLRNLVEDTFISRADLAGGQPA